MKKNKQELKSKLRLHRETIRILLSDHLASVVGGATTRSTDNCGTDVTIKKQTC